MSVSIVTHRIGSTRIQLAFVNVFALAARFGAVNFMVSCLALTFIGTLGVDALGTAAANISIFTFIHI